MDFSLEEKGCGHVCSECATKQLDTANFETRVRKWASQFDLKFERVDDKVIILQFSYNYRTGRIFVPKVFPPDQFEDRKVRLRYCSGICDSPSEAKERVSKWIKN